MAHAYALTWLAPRLIGLVGEALAWRRILGGIFFCLVSMLAIRRQSRTSQCFRMGCKADKTSFMHIVLCMLRYLQPYVVD